MDLVLLTETIIKMIVKDVEAVSAKEYESTEDDLVHIEVMVASDDLGRVIGRDGKTIKSIIMATTKQTTATIANALMTGLTNTFFKKVGNAITPPFPATRNLQKQLFLWSS